ncbi:hypothetical protein FRB93_004984 [Tulasnella sp. JGI-2019a]|nr:hypothetical protein FRB93_004984 [Tulasnella sp. JGI-2019a]
MTEPSTASSISFSIAHPQESSSSGLLQVIPRTRVNVEEEVAFYTEFPACSPKQGTLALEWLEAPHEAAPSVYSHDIWLEDKTGESKTFATNVKINGWTSVGDKKGAAYVVYDCVITLKSGQDVQILKRYSAFETLDDALHVSLPRALHHHIPALPTKNALGT